MIIGLTGAIGCGKSAAATILVTRGFVIRRFADPLKRMLRELGLSHEQTDGHKKSEPCELLGGKTPRHAMQTLGTEWGRQQIDYGLWIRAWIRSLPAGNVVADDVRFENEADTIRGLGGKVVCIVRPDCSVDSITAAHASEFGVEADAVVFNDGSLSHLAQQLDSLIRGWQ